MFPRHFRVPSVFLVMVFLAFPLFAQDPWYMGKPIERIENQGLVNVRPSAVEEVEGKYLGKEYSDELFNELQADLYGMNSFLYFLGDAEQSESGDLRIIFEFHELPYLEDVVIRGFDRLKESKVRDVVTTKVGDFALTANMIASQGAIVDLYRENGFSEATVDYEEKDDEAKNTCVVTYTIHEGPRKKINEVHFRGNGAFPEKVLKKQLDTKTASYFNAGYYEEKNIESDKAKILAYYRNNGYADAKMEDVLLTEVPSADEKDKDIRLSLTYVIDEGPLWTFGGITVEGNTVFSREELTSGMTIREGDILSSEKLTASLEAINSRYWDNGYIHSAIDVKERRDEEKHTISYTLVVNENRQAIIGDIRLEGLTKTKPYVFMREMAFRKGDVFSRAKLQKSAQNIYNTLIVTDVQMDLVDGPAPDTVIPIFTVTEGNQMTIQFGATFGGTVDSFPVSGFLQWSDKNVGGTGRTLSISTTLSPDTQEVSMSLGDNWVKDKRWSNVFSFTFTRNSKSTGLQKDKGSAGYYTGHDTDLSSDLPYPAGYNSYQDYLASGEANPSSRDLMKYDYLRLALGYTTGYTFMFDSGALSLSGGLSIGLNRAFYDDTKYDPFEYLMVKYHEAWQTSNKLNFNISWDGRDLIENTTRGYLISNQLTYAGGILGGLSNYLREVLSFSWYVSPFRYKLGERDAPVVIGSTSSLSWMLPQFWNNGDSTLQGRGWGFYDPKIGATRYEMLYIDGMNIGRGFNVVYDQSFMWNNEISIGAPLALNVLNWEIFASATGITSQYDTVAKKGFSSINWYFALGAGIKLKVPGFPLGLYLVKNAQWLSGKSFTWEKGSIFGNDSPESGLKLVLAITQTIY